MTAPRQHWLRTCPVPTAICLHTGRCSVSSSPDGLAAHCGSPWAFPKALAGFPRTTLEECPASPCPPAPPRLALPHLRNGAPHFSVSVTPSASPTSVGSVLPVRCPMEPPVLQQLRPSSSTAAAPSPFVPSGSSPAQGNAAGMFPRGAGSRAVLVPALLGTSHPPEVAFCCLAGTKGSRSKAKKRRRI